MNVGKRAVQRGGVRIMQRVVEQPVEQDVDLREERVKVERRPVDQPAEVADLSAFQEDSFEMRETAEVPVVEKTARVVEEVMVGKEVNQRTEQVSDKLRKTEVDIEQLGESGRDDAWYRDHWQNNYATAGGTYDDYEPAYRYGSTLAADKRYQGRGWNEFESDARSDWEKRNPGSAWERVKDAVRSAWERISSAD
jgi:uncharacterized protein (TIGR02271 family)